MAKDCTNVAITKVISTRRMSSQCPDTGIQPSCNLIENVVF
ncbi:hypothetical protein [Wolbachia endosymbiont of Psylliodes chrysocephala]|nr:hypothetical protein [Wolbachia endosymbiont of Psylliodes chrysocephala]